MNGEPDELELVCETPHRDAVRIAFDALDVRCAVRGPRPIAQVEARIGERRLELAPAPGAAGPGDPRGSALRFAGRLPLAGLTRGLHAVTVVARDSDGHQAVAVTEVDVQPFDTLPADPGAWRELIAGGQPVVRLERHALGAARPGWPAAVVVDGFAFCTQGLARLSVIVDGRCEAEPFHGVYRPELEALLGTRAGVGAGFRGELLGLDAAPGAGPGSPAGDRELVVLAVAPDGRAAGWRGLLPATAVPAAQIAQPQPPQRQPLPPLQPPPRLRAEGASLAGEPPPGADGWRRLAEAWAERALRAEGEHETEQIDRSWAGLQTRLAAERAAEGELARRAAAPRPLRFPAVAAPLVSVVVTVHDGVELTARCLRALARPTERVPFEVVVVVDGDDREVGRLLDAVEGAQVLRNAANLGYVRSANRGAAAARGTHVVQLNNDTEPQPGWLDALVARLDGDDEIGVVVPKLLFPDGRLQEAGSIVWSDGRGWNYGIGDDETAPAYNAVREVDYGSAAAMLVRGSLWRRLGGFDERFLPAYYEDVDLCFSARAHGLCVVYEPAARVVHARGGSMGSDALDLSQQLIEANRATFRRKWATTLPQQSAYGPDRIDAAARRSDRRSSRR